MQKQAISLGFIVLASIIVASRHHAKPQPPVTWGGYAIRPANRVTA